MAEYGNHGNWVIRLNYQSSSQRNFAVEIKKHILAAVVVDAVGDAVEVGTYTMADGGWAVILKT